MTRIRSFTWKYVAVVAFAALAVVAFFYFRPEPKTFHKAHGELWTTEYHVTYESGAPLMDSVEAVLDLVDENVSAFNVRSLVSRINRNETNRADSLFRRLYATSLEVNRESGGAFDPTVMPLVNAWGFGYKKGKMPTKAQIDSILAFVGLQKTHLVGKILKKDDARIEFDFSSIAKGMACDEVGRMLERNGCENYMVEIGGEVAVKGKNEQGEKWCISIDMPTQQHETALVVHLSDQGIATSGNYRRYKDVQGMKVSHIVNPKTGQGEASNLLSVTVVAPDCMTADAWATGCMVMGFDAVKSRFEHDKKLAVMTICSDAEGNLVAWSNEAFAALMK